MRIRILQRRDIKQAALLAKKTFEKYNGDDYFDVEGVRKTLDHFDPSKHGQKEFEDKFLSDQIFYVAEEGDEIVGMIRGRPDKVSSLFVSDTHHGLGIGKKLMQAFEKKATALGATQIKIRSSLFAVPFYQRMGYKKTTGIRNFMGLKIYNMKKEL